MTSKHYFQNCSRKIREIYVSWDCSTENQLLPIAFLYFFLVTCAKTARNKCWGGITEQNLRFQAYNFIPNLVSRAATAVALCRRVVTQRTAALLFPASAPLLPHQAAPCLGGGQLVQSLLFESEVLCLVSFGYPFVFLQTLP